MTFGTLRVPAWSAQVLLGIKILVSTLGQVLGTSTIQADPHFHNKKSAIISKKIGDFIYFIGIFSEHLKCFFFQDRILDILDGNTMAPVIFHHETRIFQPRLIPGYTLRGIAWVKVGHPEMVYSSKKKISKHPSSNTKLSLFLKYLEIILNHFKSIFKYSQFRRETTLPWKRLQVEALKGLIPQSNRQSARRLTMKPCNKCLANRFPVNGCDFPVNRPIFLFHSVSIIIESSSSSSSVKSVREKSPRFKRGNVRLRFAAPSCSALARSPEWIASMMARVSCPRVCVPKLET